ncbi:hypothetical protein [Solirhodobacter olei]|uniref:hypothetical protein n=1 Tax=Solirhodobacter olei TaxID=2493082 RepID=UPI000FD93F1B|nr:hypothetical protein [Solirhodobacter olei]
MHFVTRRAQRNALLTFLVLTAGPAFAGDGNSLYVKQVSTAGGVSGNTLYIDQSAASSSHIGNIASVSLYANDKIGSIPYPQGQPATQNGQNNSASVTITGTNGLAALLQDNSGTTYGGNQANVTINGAGFGSVEQTGDLNQAKLTVNGASVGAISQEGDSNIADLTVSTGVVGVITQNGSGNDQAVVASGSAGAKISYTVNGNNLHALAPVHVVTNSSSVSITQTN